METLHLLLIVLANFVSFAGSSSLSSSDQAGFIVPMIHRHSPLSPYTNPIPTILDVVEADKARVEYLKSKISWSGFRGAFDAPLKYAPGTYLMVFFVGSSLTKMYVHMDTGSDLTWIRCLPCNYCGDKIRPPFNPMKSTTYRRLPCNSLCKSERGLRCVSDDSCIFFMKYMDRTQVFGGVATETIHIPTMVGGIFHNITDVVFGCAHLDFYDNSSSAVDGILGLGRGPLSLVSQLPASKFSYCLSPPPPPGKSEGYDSIRFGSQAKLLGGRTPLVRGLRTRFRGYHLALEGISVGAERIPIPDGTFDGRNSIVIDSGTTFTLLRPQGHAPLSKALDDVVTLWKAPPHVSLNNCYYGTVEDVAGVTVTFHFANVDVTLSKWSLFAEFGRYVCTAIQSESRMSIFGMYSQINYNVGYDLGSNNEISFQPMDCSTS